ncbi:MAG: hypothetical protein ABII27_01155 [bacterium]
MKNLALVVIVLIGLWFLINRCSKSSVTKISDNNEIHYSDKEALAFKNSITKISFPASGQEILDILGIEEDKVPVKTSYIYDVKGDYIFILYFKVSKSYILMLIQTEKPGNWNSREYTLEKNIFSKVIIGELGDELDLLYNENLRKQLGGSQDSLKRHLKLSK